MQKSLSLFVVFLFSFAVDSLAQGEFYTINHDTQVILRASEKSESEEKYYDSEGPQEILIYRTGIDRPVKLIGNVNLVSSSIDFEIGEVKHTLAIDEIDSILVSEINDIFGNGFKAKYVNSQLFSSEGGFYIEILAEGPSSVVMRRTTIKVRKANYNRALDIGNKKDSYKVRTEYYFYSRGSGMVKLPTDKKGFKRFLNVNESYLHPDLADIADMDAKQDLKLLVKYFNNK